MKIATGRYTNSFMDLRVDDSGSSDKMGFKDLHYIDIDLSGIWLFLPHFPPRVLNFLSTTCNVNHIYIYLNPCAMETYSGEVFAVSFSPTTGSH